jgi:hypothetical protein
VAGRWGRWRAQGGGARFSDQSLTTRPSTSTQLKTPPRPMRLQHRNRHSNCGNACDRMQSFDFPWSCALLLNLFNLLKWVLLACSGRGPPSRRRRFAPPSCDPKHSSLLRF